MSKITRLKRRLKKAGITQDQLALRAEVTRFMVNHVLNERCKSRRILLVAEQMLVERAAAEIAAALPPRDAA